MPDREPSPTLPAAQILEGEKPETSIRTLYERYNQSQEVGRLDGLQREIDIWAQEPTHGGVDLQEILDQHHQAERAVKPLRDPIDEQNKDRYPNALGIPRSQLEDLVIKNRSVQETYGSLRRRLFDFERRIAPDGPLLRSAETDALKTLERFNETIVGKMPEYVAKLPQEVIATLRAELSAPFETTEPAVPAGSAPAEPPPAELGPLTSSTAPEPLEPAAKEPAAPLTVEPQPLSPEQQAEKWVIDKIGRENAKVEAGQKPKWGGKPDALIEFLKSRGVSESQIMRWGSTRCFDEAAKILGLERKSLPRSEAPEEERFSELEERVKTLEERLTALEEEKRNLIVTLEKSEEDKEILLKAVKGKELSPDEETRLAELKGEAPPIEEVEEEAEVEAEEATPPEKPEKTGFIAKAKSFLHNWWKAVSPQGRNKWCWGFGVAIGALEQLGLRPLLTPIVGPAAGWAVSGVNALAIQGINYRLQRGITEAKSNGDAKALSEREARYKKFSDVVAGIAAGSLGSAVGSVIWEGFVAPKLPTAPPEALAAQPTLPVEGVTPPIGEIVPPAEAVVSPPLTPGPEVVVPPITSPPVEKLVEYTVRPGDTISEVLARMGHDPYGPDLTKLILDNAELLASKGEEYARAVELVKAHPDWIARGGGTETWRTIMQAARLIHPGDFLKIP